MYRISNLGRGSSRDKGLSRLCLIILLVLSALFLAAALYFLGIIKIYSPIQEKTDDNIQLKSQTIDFREYYWATNLKTDKSVSGLLQLDDGAIYIEPDTHELAYGFREINGNYYDFTKPNGYDSAVSAYHTLAKKTNLSSNNSVIESAIANGLDLVGKSPYDLGGGRDADSIAKNEFDCSSFVNWMYAEAGLNINYQDSVSTTYLAEDGTTVSWAQKTRGDLLVNSDPYDEDLNHVAIYLGDNFILHDSVSTDGVSISRLNQVINRAKTGTMTWADLFDSDTNQNATVQRVAE